MVFNGRNLGVLTMISDKNDKREGIIHKCVHKRVCVGVQVTILCSLFLVGEKETGCLGSLIGS